MQYTEAKSTLPKSQKHYIKLEYLTNKSFICTNYKRLNHKKEYKWIFIS